MELDVMNSESPATVPAADALAPLLGSLFGGRLPVRFEFWDGCALGPRDGPGTSLSARLPRSGGCCGRLGNWVSAGPTSPANWRPKVT